MEYTFDMAVKAEDFNGYTIIIDEKKYFIEYFLMKNRWFAYDPFLMKETITQGNDVKKVFTELVNILQKSNHPDEIEVLGLKFERQDKDNDYYVEYICEPGASLLITLHKSLQNLTWNAYAGHHRLYPVAHTAGICHDDRGYETPELALANLVDNFEQLHKANEQLLKFLKFGII